MMRSLDEDFAYEQLRQKRIDNMTKHDSVMVDLIAEVGRLQRQLAEREKQIVMLRGFVKLLRDYIPASAIGNMTVQDALAATQDLSGLVLCDAEPVSHLYRHRSNYTGEFIWSIKSTYNGNQAIATLPLYKAKESK